jgi:N-acyl-L-homoserine lactone synthetase
VTQRAGPLDALVVDIVGRCGYRFTIAADDSAREVAYRLRYEAVVERGWAREAELPDGRECDAYDAHAVHLICWDDERAVATGRLVLPTAVLPTEAVCGLTIEPRGRVVDVGRMSVARSHQSHRHSVFLALLARLYIEVQQQGYGVACGLVSARARSLMRLLGLQLEVLGEERQYWGELRTPVRFRVDGDEADPAAGGHGTA